MPRDCESSAGIGEFETGRPVFALQPASQKPGHEPVAGTENVENVNRETFAALSLVETIGNCAFENHCPHGAAFAHQCSIRHVAHGFQRLQRICRTARNMKFLFGSDDEIKQMERRLQFGGNGCGFDETVLTVAVAGKPQRLGR